MFVQPFAHQCVTGIHIHIKLICNRRERKILVDNGDGFVSWPTTGTTIVYLGRYESQEKKETIDFVQVGAHSRVEITRSETIVL